MILMAASTVFVIGVSLGAALVVMLAAGHQRWKLALTIHALGKFSAIAMALRMAMDLLTVS